MKIQHKYNKKIIEKFPSYGKYYYSIYGYLIVTCDNRVLFFYPMSEAVKIENTIEVEDITNEYIIIND